jgi:hypothetical protein
MRYVRKNDTFYLILETYDDREAFRDIDGGKLASENESEIRALMKRIVAAKKQIAAYKRATVRIPPQVGKLKVGSEKVFHLDYTLAQHRQGSLRGYITLPYQDRDFEITFQDKTVKVKRTR